MSDMFRMLQIQRSTIREAGVKGLVWISKILLPIPEEDERKALLGSVEELKESGNASQHLYALSELAIVPLQQTRINESFTPERNHIKGDCSPWCIVPHERSSIVSAHDL